MKGLNTYIKYLLISAEKAHAEYERTTLGGIRDKHWAGWCAGYITDKINYQFGLALTAGGIGATPNPRVGDSAFDEAFGKG